MPELPEVETVRIGLSQLLPGKTITRVTFDMPKSFPNADTDVRQFLIGSKVVEVTRRAKVLLIELSSKYSLVIHLKMTGQLVYVENRHKQIPNPKHETLNKSQITNTKVPNSLEFRNSDLEIARSDEVRFGAGHPNDSLVGELPDKSTRVTFEFDNGAHLFFNDQRKFGWVRLLPTAEVPNIDFFKKVGPEPLSSEFTSNEFASRLKRRSNSSIKAVLLDQSVIAGVGNIYADESLWGAKIHPATLVKDVSTAKIATLYQELRDVLELSIQKGGSTDRNYVDAKGKRGSYLSFARVFRREGQACPRCGTVIIKIRVAGRGTHICPREQKLIKAQK